LRIALDILDLPNVDCCNLTLLHRKEIPVIEEIPPQVLRKTEDARRWGLFLRTWEQSLLGVFLLLQP
jgi:hypothetical protein